MLGDVKRSSPAKMKPSMDDHRKKFHPNWVQPERKSMSSYRLDYSNRARQF
jgi:hypothetical protein